MPDPSGRPYLSEVVDQTTIETYSDAGDTKIRTTSSVPLQTTAALDIYLDPIGGDDASDGLTTATAVRTVERVDELIPMLVHHRVWVHCAHGDCTVGRDFAFRERVFGGAGYVRLYADAAWDAAVYTVVDSGTAQASTTGDVIKTTGSLSAVGGQWVQLTSGAASGQITTIRNVVGATDIVPCCSFDFLGAAPASGDSYRVLTPAFRLVFSSSYYYTLVQGSAAAGNPAAINDAYTAATENRWQFEGIGLDAYGYLILGGHLRLLGVYVTVQGGFDALAYIAHGAYVEAGADHPFLETTKRGWGLTLVGPTGGATLASQNSAVADFRFTGYVVTDVVNAYSGKFAIYGGDALALVAINSAELSAVAESDVPFRLRGFAQSGEQPERHQVSFVQLSKTEITYAGASAAIRVYGGTMVLASTVTGAGGSGAVNVDANAAASMLILDGAPAFGHASATDYDIGDGMPFNKADVVAGFRRFFDGRLMERV